MSSNFISHFNFISLIFLLIFCKGCLGATFTLTNRCDYAVWPGILANAGSDKLDSTGFELPSGGTRSFQAPPGWSGRFWGRTRCSFDPNTGQGSCATGDCSSNQVECNGAGATPPATLAEFMIGSGTNSGAQDFYDVSLVDGYNLPMMVQAKDGTGPCGSTGCTTDLNQMCPNDLRVGDGQACKSACEAFGNPEYCCSGAYGSPTACRPSVYSEIFKTACPRSYSYAYDDATSTFTCSGADYTITFCPSLTSQKSSRNSSSPETAIGTTNEPPALIVEGSGSDSQDNSLPSSWLPNFVTGDSSRTILNVDLHFTLSVTFFILSFLCI
ncbi:thaumatin-like protein 1 [Olea europaea var. sylvestris]|uniref:thaumatin-like protein 1 n=1 Tax=Olea europaea var. sylvestris TaxID=158386 RepID=UPI000C1CE8AD|nr:thaumatin-like protein 1 [Olea europaea var. sylvestris]